MVILSIEIMQNHQKIYPQKGLRVIYPDDVVTENGEFLYMIWTMRKIYGATLIRICRRSLDRKQQSKLLMTWTWRKPKRLKCTAIMKVSRENLTNRRRIWNQPHTSRWTYMWMIQSRCHEGTIFLGEESFIGNETLMATQLDARTRIQSLIHIGMKCNLTMVKWLISLPTSSRIGCMLSVKETGMICCCFISSLTTINHNRKCLCKIRR